jgi:peptide/nickel transport system permease protein
VGAFAVKRIGWGLLTLFVLSALVFLMIHRLPGDPIDVQLGKAPDPTARAETARAELRALYNLDESLPSQYTHYVSQVLQGNFGRSFSTGEPVGPELLQRFTRTLLIMGGAVVLALMVAVPLALISASRARGLRDSASLSTAIVLQSVPEFWVGTMLALVVGVQWGVLPTSGYVSPSESLTEFLRHSILPTVTLAVVLAGVLARTLRVSLRDEMRQDYVALARSQGIPHWRVLSLHMLRNAAAPTLTVVGLQIGFLLGGAVVTERVFSYPGMGFLLTDAIGSRDYSIAQGAMLLFGATFVVVNLLVDLGTAYLDPRSRRALQARRRPALVAPAGAPLP